MLINVYVASPDTDPNPRGGGQLPKSTGLDGDHINTKYNVCSVHRGVFSTSGGYHGYIGGDIMSTLGGIS